MKLSIITVNLNNRDGLKKTIDSVVAQTFKDFEWIVIDGGSTDGSRDLIEEYSEHFSYWVSEPDKGVYNAMNKGIIVAKGEYLLFLNAGDSFVGSRVLECVIPYLNDDVVYGDYNYVFPDGRVVAKKGPDAVSMTYMYKSSLCHQASFFRRVLFDENLYTESLKITSDWEFCVKMILDGKGFKHIPVLVCDFSMGGISSSNIKLRDDEKKCLIQRYFPRALLEDILLFQNVESHVANVSADEFCLLCEQNRFLAKIITAMVLLMKLISKNNR